MVIVIVLLSMENYRACHALGSAHTRFLQHLFHFIADVRTLRNKINGNIYFISLQMCGQSYLTFTFTVSSRLPVLTFLIVVTHVVIDHHTKVQQKVPRVLRYSTLVVILHKHIQQQRSRRRHQTRLDTSCARLVWFSRSPSSMRGCSQLSNSGCINAAASIALIATCRYAAQYEKYDVICKTQST